MVEGTAGHEGRSGAAIAAGTALLAAIFGFGGLAFEHDRRVSDEQYPAGATGGPRSDVSPAR